MLSQLTIPQKHNRPAALDHQHLYAAGLQQVQQLAQRIWTDYNVHDPGITTLELLCYALTDLSYRASFPIADILASDPALNHDTFFTARQILPNRALTVLDYRKLLIDLPGVKNAWINPTTITYYANLVQKQLQYGPSEIDRTLPVNLAGLYKVTIEYMDGINTNAEKEAIQKLVWQCLQANRNLCEDFIALEEITTQNFLLCAELELTPDADVAKVNAEIWFQVQQYLAPGVRNYRLSEMLSRKKADGTAYTIDEIFDGPALNCGFIDDGELAQAELRTEIRLSDVISIVMDIPGVQAVREIVINPAGTEVPLATKWVVPVAAQHKALLDRDQSRLVFYKRQMPVVANRDRVNRLYAELTQAVTVKAEAITLDDLPIPPGNPRSLDRYYSFQNHFPAIYGLSQEGLPSNADSTRKALAYQLKAYLLFFDQIMANYFAQLHHVKDLFSIDPELRRTYFYQVVDSFSNYQTIYHTTEDRDPVEVIRTLQTQQDSQEQTSGFDRRNRFLDHLIARFAEQFHDLAYTLYSAFGTSAESLIRYKCDFLKHYPEISSERSLAYNYTLQGEGDLWNSENVSGLEKRLAKLLGIQNYKRRNLGDIAYDIYAEIDSTPENEFRFRIRNRDTLAIILSSSRNYETQVLARQAMERAIKFALSPANYDRKISSNAKHYFNVIDDAGEVVARRIEYFDTEDQMNQAIDEVLHYLQVNYSDEGMYLIENILLRPEEETDPFLPICVDSNCSDCAEADPYSYRIHIILPDYGSRFSDMAFRRFAEQVIREETPAHILPKICWINAENMAIFEKLYYDWIHLKAGVNSTQRSEKLKNWIDHLFAVKNVYPPRRLRDCDSEENQPKFILGRSNLGTGENLKPDT
ncbi:MAG: diguanylate cyclase [Alkalinema sp. CACIAM 70d]|nr:MAG: diguanylate cyclase [Alkalinema sp. CACIAM 70d]